MPIGDYMTILFPYLARWHSANRSRYHQLLTHLCLRGHRVLILTAPPMALSDISSRDIGQEDRRLPDGLIISELFAPGPLRAFWQLDLPRTKLIKKGLLAISSIPQLQRVIKREKVDLLFLYNLPQVMLMELADCPVHFDLADDLVAMMEGEDRQLFKYGGRAAASFVQGRMIERARTVTVASSVLAEQLDRKVLMLPNGADLTELDEVRAQGPRPAAQSIPADTADTGQTRPGTRPVVGFVGAFEYWIDFELLTGVAARLRSFDFLLVGGGRRLDELRALVTRLGLTNVQMTGPKPYHEAMREVVGMDVCLLPFSHSPVSDGSCPLKLFEYAALRRPIVSTSTTEVERIGQGWVHFADSVDAFAAAITSCLTDRQETERALDTGRQRVEAVYNWPHLAAQFEQYLMANL